MASAESDIDKIRESFEPRLITALYKNFSDQYVALLELVDNAVDDKVDGKTIYIDIVFDDNSLTIKNYDGKGMDRNDLIKFFTWGSSNKAKRIGRYGQGGKAALGYLGKGFEMRAHPQGSENGYLLRVDDWQDRTDGFKEISVEPFTSLHGIDSGAVEIKILGLSKEFSQTAVIKRITDTYRPLILNDEILFGINSIPIACQETKYDKGTRHDFDIPFKLDNMNYRLHGNYGMISDSDEPRRGFNIYQFGRRVARNEYFGHIDPSKKWNVEKFYGELYLNFEIPLLMNKTDADRDSLLWQKIIELMNREIAPTMRLAVDYRSPTTKEKKTIAKIAKKVHKVDGKDDLDVRLGNYGPSQLFKNFEDPDHSPVLIINREHKVYEKWSKTAFGKQLYAVMVCALYAATKNLSKKEAAVLLNSFSDALNEHSFKLL